LRRRIVDVAADTDPAQETARVFRRIAETPLRTDKVDS
jgi:hypothetical protein